MNFDIDYKGNPATLSILRVADETADPLGVQVTVWDKQPKPDGLYVALADGVIELPDLLAQIAHSDG